jgi:hypothetical protein
MIPITHTPWIVEHNFRGGNSWWCKAGIYQSKEMAKIVAGMLNKKETGYRRFVE